MERHDEQLTKAFGKRLKKWRSAQGLTQQCLADALEITVSTISHSERGRSLLTPVVLVRLHDVYGVSLNWLLLGKGEMLFRHDEAVVAGNERYEHGEYLVSEITRDYDGKPTTIGIKREGDFELNLRIGGKTE